VVATFSYLRQSRAIFRNVFEWIRTVERVSADKVLIRLRTQFRTY